jgi:Uma2 family endonuclease
MSSMPKPLTETDDDLIYPESDGQPMGETDWHILAMMLLRQALDDVFADQADVYVGSDLFFYYIEGDPSASTAPDGMVVKGVGKHLRRTFKTWVEKAIPSVMIEICSQKTWKGDLGAKRLLYERLRVAEYFVFDPEARYVKPPLRGFRLRRGKFQPLAAAVDGSLTSKELGLRLVAEGHMLRLIDARTGEPILTRQESKEQERRGKEQEKQRADLAEQQKEQERQSKEQEKQRADLAEQQKEQQRQRADLAEQQKEQQKQRADTLAAELARLRTEPGKRRGKNQ